MAVYGAKSSEMDRMGQWSLQRSLPWPFKGSGAAMGAGCGLTGLASQLRLLWFYAKVPFVVDGGGFRYEVCVTIKGNCILNDTNC